ncbi:MAG: sulfatase-like hydrolase/transferase [Mariniphaga sp.]|nr:sulfatase-like hydrolase/transferase [Mariniphaga sp.]
MNELHSTGILFYIALILGVAQDSYCQLSSQSLNNKKPNFIIILADDLGYGDIGCYGNSKILTPNLNLMAKRGVRFLDFHSNGAVCSPTRSALLTGKYPQRTGITGVITAKKHRDVGLALSEITIAEDLKKAGYVTGMFGKWHLGYSPKYNPVHQGFDEFIGYVSGNVDYQSHVDQEGNADWWKADKLENETGYSTDLILRNANDFIIKHQKSPFLLYIAHEAPHSPYQNRSSKADRYEGAKNGIDFPTNGSEKDAASKYKDMIEILDESVGKTIETLKRLGLYENTIVIFCSDNGATQKGSNGVLKGFKGSVWEGGHRVPAIIQWPGRIKSGWISHETVLTMDIFPTLLELAGVTELGEIDGKSINEHLLHQKSLAYRTIFWQHEDKYAVRKGKWKLVVSELNTKPELYDMMTDFEEKNNVADSYPNIINDLQAEYEKWVSKVNKGVKIIS